MANLWLKGPESLADPESWAAEILTEPSKETEAEAKLTKEVFGTVAETKNDLDETLNKHSFWKTMRVTVWIMLFVRNCKQKISERLAGPLITPEPSKAVHRCVKRAQESNMGTEKFKQDRLSLKCARYLRRCKNVLWSPWTGEYIRSVRGRHNLNLNKGGPPIEQGDVVLIQSDEGNRGKWNIRVVVKLINGRDGIF